jgi:hypothetical protein
MTSEPEMTRGLTDCRIFERPAKRDAEGQEIFGPNGPVYEDLRHFLPGAAAVPNITIERSDQMGLVTNVEHRFVVHSPTGFECGYAGSGPADFALNILALFVPPPEAYRLHQAYKSDVIAALKVKVGSGAYIAAASVRKWLVDKWNADGPGWSQRGREP